MVLKRAVILKMYHIFKDAGGRIKNDPRKMLLKHFKQRSSKLKRLLPGSGETDCKTLS